MHSDVASKEVQLGSLNSFKSVKIKFTPQGVSKLEL